MQPASFRFYAELNSFLPPDARWKVLSYPVNGRVAVKHPVEAWGVPHTEVGLLLVNGRSVGFSYLLRPGDRITVYPPFLSLDVDGLQRLRPPLPQPPRFLLDNHLGRLATYLRLLGFDTRFERQRDDAALAELAERDDRVLLTRDRRLLMRKIVIHGYCLRTRQPEAQLRAVLHRFQLRQYIDPWQRCLRCNGRLQPVDKAVVWDRLEPLTKIYYDEFHICQNCQQIYWKGSHYAALEQLVSQVSAS
ncbi:MAG: Mut7-C RNAse domain-containing protein [Candidatus Promineifilaceae bacterium]|nr:Mut7-C RNAse domain-containing protein [Candidatus Promineifilaceae bacterium]